VTKQRSDIDLALRRFHGLATNAELAAAGFSAARIRTQVRAGALIQLSRGVYALPGLAEAAAGDPAREHALAAAAAIRRIGSGVVASHQSAAIIHNLSLMSRPDEAAVTLTRSPLSSRSHSGRAGTTVHMAELAPGQLSVIHGVPVTTVARTVVDLARITPFVEGVVVTDSALHSKKTTRAQLSAVQAACVRWPGSRRAEQVIAFSDQRSESVLESVARVAFHEHGLPAPKLQAWVGGEDGTAGRADFFWPEHSTIGEADGAMKYITPNRPLSQLDRDAWLRDAGFEVVHFTWHQIVVARAQVVASLKAAFRRAAAVRALALVS
jgi:predicted transcriptional regulator of viral defense system